jgi:hypothetical protein
MKTWLFIGGFFCLVWGTICFFLGYLRTNAYIVEDPVFSMVSTLLYGLGVGLLLLFCIDDARVSKVK